MSDKVVDSSLLPSSNDAPISVLLDESVVEKEAHRILKILTFGERFGHFERGLDILKRYGLV